MFTCFDDYMFTCLHALMIGLNALMITCFYVYMPLWSYTSMFMCLNEHMFPCLHALTITCPYACVLSCSFVWSFDDHMLTCTYALMLKCSYMLGLSIEYMVFMLTLGCTFYWLLTCLDAHTITCFDDLTLQNSHSFLIICYYAACFDDNILPCTYTLIFTCLISTHVHTVGWWYVSMFGGLSDRAVAHLYAQMLWRLWLNVEVIRR